MPQYIFDLRISATEFLRYYQGEASWVHVRDNRGRSIRFPAPALIQREIMVRLGILD